MSFEPRHSDLPQSGIRDDSGRGRWAAPVVWLLAAALTAVAPFLDFYSTEGIISLTTDGFGRERVVELGNDGVFYGGGAPGEHGPRIGIALLAAAALLVVAVVWSLVRSGRAATMVGLAGSTAAVFVALAVLLETQSRVSSNTRHLQVRPEVGVWLALAAGVVGVAGAVLAVRAVAPAD